MKRKALDNKLMLKSGHTVETGGNIVVKERRRNWISP